MFKCPNCGYKESPIWRASPYVIYAVYCTQDELLALEPELYNQLKDLVKKEYREIGPYTYWLRGRLNHVYRILTELRSYSIGNQTEKPKNKHKAK